MSLLDTIWQQIRQHPFLAISTMAAVYAITLGGKGVLDRLASLVLRLWRRARSHESIRQIPPRLSTTRDIATLPNLPASMLNTVGVQEVVAKTQAPGVLVITGARGSGKSTAAVAGLQAVLSQHSNRRPSAFLFVDCRAAENGTASVCDAVAQQVDYPAVLGASGDSKVDVLRKCMGELAFKTYLLIDNFESLGIAQAETFALLRTLPGAIKVVITTSERQPWMPPDVVHHMTPMSESESHSYIKRLSAHLSSSSNDIAELAHNIYARVGGNPLAINWLLGQAHDDPDFIADNSAASHVAPAELRDHVFTPIWARLTSSERQALALISAFPTHAPRRLIKELLQQDESLLSATLDTLTRNHLITVSAHPGLLGSHITLHGLTSAFVTSLSPRSPYTSSFIAQCYLRFLENHPELTAAHAEILEVETELGNLLPLMRRLDQLGQTDDWSSLTIYLLDYLNLFGRYELRARLARQAAELFRKHSQWSQHAAMLTILAGSLLAQGSLVDAREVAEQSVAVADRRARSFSRQARALRILGVAEIALGNLDPAAECLERAMPLALRSRDYEIQVELQLLRASLAVAHDDLDDVEPAMVETLRLASHMSWGRPLGYVSEFRAVVHFARNQLVDATREIDQGLRVASDYRDRRLAVRLRLLHMSLCARRGDFGSFLDCLPSLGDEMLRLGLSRELGELEAQQAHWTFWRRQRHRLLARLCPQSAHTPIRYADIPLDSI